MDPASAARTTSAAARPTRSGRSIPAGRTTARAAPCRSPSKAQGRWHVRGGGEDAAVASGNPSTAWD